MIKYLRSGCVKAQTQLDEVAAALGVTKPAIYHYSPNREALMRAAVAQDFLKQDRVLVEAARARKVFLPDLTWDTAPFQDILEMVYQRKVWGTVDRLHAIFILSGESH